MDFQKIYDSAFNWVLKYGPKIIIAIILFILSQWFIRLTRKWLTKILERRKFNSSLVPFLISLAVTILQVIIIIGLFQFLGLQLTIFTAIIGGISVAGGLALSGTLQNFTSGILILILKPYSVGDNILVQGFEGTVTGIQIFYTTVNTFDNKTVIIPNSKLSNDIVVNLSREGIRRVDIEWKFNFGFQFEQLKNIFLTAINTMPEILKEPAARIAVSDIEPDGYKITVNVWTKADGFYDSKFSIQKKLMEDLKSNGIKLPGM